MKSEPRLNESSILEALHCWYGLQIQRLTFLTTGWASYCYRADAVGGDSYLLKVYDGSMPEPLVATSREFYLPLTYQLCVRGVLPQIACPVPAKDGRLWISVEKNHLMLFHFIEGEVVEFGELSNEVLAKLAPMVGRLHKATASMDLRMDLGLTALQVEDFRIAFEEYLPAELDALANLGPGSRATLRDFKELLVPYRKEIRTYLNRLKEYQGIMREQSGSRMVVCHTDLHGGNLIVHPSGDLYIIDWEGAMVAPPEHDLFWFAGKDTFWDLFLPEYEREFGPARLNVDAFGFYYYRRGLEDIAEWVQNFLEVDQGDEREREAIYWARETLADLSKVEMKLERIRRAVEGRE